MGGSRAAVMVGLIVGGMLSCAGARADNWPQWRGPKNDGISLETSVPVKWSDKDGVAWRVELPGPGGATPVVWGDNIFVTSAAETDLVLICIGTDGKQKWSKVIASGNAKVRGDEGNYASPSPCTDGEHVYCMMGQGSIACFTNAGEEKWKFNLQDRYGKFSIAFGMTSTPVLDGNHLYIQLIHGEGNAKTREAKIVCLDKKTGAEVWKAERPSEAYGENEHSYASPVIYRDEKRAYLLSHGADYIVAHNLNDGSEAWRSAGLQHPKYNSTLRLVASPVAVPGLIVAPSAKNGPVIALRPDGKGDITESTEFRIWTRKENTPDVPSPLVWDGLVYMCRENGVLICVDAKTGEEIYQKSTTRDRHRASPFYAAGNIYTTARDGTVTVTRAGRDFEIVAQNKINEDTSASPAVANGRIYLRTFKALWAIGK